MWFTCQTKAGDLDDKYYKLYKANIRSKIDDRESYNHYWKAINDNLKGINKVYLSADGIYHLINISSLKTRLAVNMF